jgi:hypothetical protein
MSAHDRLFLITRGRVEAATHRRGLPRSDVCPHSTIPDRAGRAHQFGCHRHDKESVVRPPEGRAWVGPADRFAISPPRTSITRYAADLFTGVVTDVDELLCAQGKRGLTAGSAPAPMTYEPAPRANWVAIEPTMPARTVHEDAGSISDSRAKEAIRLTVSSLLCAIY